MSTCPLCGSEIADDKPIIVLRPNKTPTVVVLAASAILFTLTALSMPSLPYLLSPYFYFDLSLSPAGLINWGKFVLLVGCPITFALSLRDTINLHSMTYILTSSDLVIRNADQITRIPLANIQDITICQDPLDLITGCGDLYVNGTQGKLLNLHAPHDYRNMILYNKKPA